MQTSRIHPFLEQSDNLGLTESLEILVDGYSFEQIIESLEEICLEKSDHLSSNWQDTEGAKDWSRKAHLIQSFLMELI